MVEVLAPIVLILIVVAGFVGVFWMFRSFRRQNEKMQDEPAGRALAELARQRGWNYEPENVGFADHVVDYPVHGSTHERAFRQHAYQLVTGTHRDREFGCFQYRDNPGASPGDGDVSVRYFRIFAIHLPTRVPLLWFEESAESARYKNQIVTGDSGFDSAFTIVADDERFASALLDRSVRRWLLSDPRARQTSVRFSGGLVLHYYRQREPFDVTTVEPTLDFLCDLLDRLPAGVLR